MREGDSVTVLAWGKVSVRQLSKSVGNRPPQWSPVGWPDKSSLTWMAMAMTKLFGEASNPNKLLPSHHSCFFGQEDFFFSPWMKESWNLQKRGNQKRFFCSQHLHWHWIATQGDEIAAKIIFVLCYQLWTTNTMLEVICVSFASDSQSHLHDQQCPVGFPLQLHAQHSLWRRLLSR